MSLPASGHNRNDVSSCDRSSCWRYVTGIDSDDTAAVRPGDEVSVACQHVSADGVDMSERQEWEDSVRRECFGDH